MASARERRLWLIAAALTVLIFASLATAGRLAGALGDRSGVDAAFGGAVLVVVVALALRAVAVRPTAATVAIALGSGAVVALLVVRSGIPPVERTHLIEYAVLAAVVHAAMDERARHVSRIRHPAIIAAMLSGTIGILDELVQLLIPSRVFDVRDIAFNVLAAVGAVVMTVLLHRIASRAGRPPG